MKNLKCSIRPGAFWALGICAAISATAFADGNCLYTVALGYGENTTLKGMALSASETAELTGLESHLVRATERFREGHLAQIANLQYLVRRHQFFAARADLQFSAGRDEKGWKTPEHETQFGLFALRAFYDLAGIFRLIEYYRGRDPGMVRREFKEKDSLADAAIRGLLRHHGLTRPGADPAKKINVRLPCAGGSAAEFPAMTWNEKLTKKALLAFLPPEGHDELRAKRHVEAQFFVSPRFEIECGYPEKKMVLKGAQGKTILVVPLLAALDHLTELGKLSVAGTPVTGR